MKTSGHSSKQPFSEDSDRKAKKNFLTDYFDLLRLLTHVGFLRQNGVMLSEAFFAYAKKQESRKKIYHNTAKKFHLPEEV